MSDPLAALATLAEAERASGQGGHAQEVFRWAFLSVAFEVEARAWAEETGHAVEGHGFRCRPSGVPGN